MPHRIEVAFKEGMTDAAGNGVRKRIAEDLAISVDYVRTVDVYTIDAELNEEQLVLLGENLFADPITQTFSYDEPLDADYDWLIEVGFKPGVTDNVGKTAREGIKDILGINANVYTSRQYLISGRITSEDAEMIASGLLANTLIERWIVKRKGEAVEISLPLVRTMHEPKVEKININVSDEALMQISKERLLVLSLDEMKAIKDHYNNPAVLSERKKLGLSSPTDVELEAIAQTWSEHCKHKIFNAVIEYEENGKKEKIDSLFKTYIRKSTEEIGKDWLVSVFRDNAGIIRFIDGWNLVMKVETHNTPSALEPYGGALTGIVGVNRDSIGTGIGAKPIFNTDVFCFAPPDYSKAMPPRLLHPKRIFEGVRRGVEHGGNKSGIPTVNGSIVFDERFLGKPLVYCGTGGIMPSMINGTATDEKRIDDDDFIVMTGGRIGKDGIHGATFSSEELHESSPVSAVQIGDPITQKKMLDFLMEARDLGLYNAITDNGAGGLSSSVGEMAQLSGGCEIHLDRCPLKYAGLDPWEILLSEAQERMTLSVAPDLVDGFLDLAKRRDVEATVIGKFTSSGRFHVMYKGKTIAYIDMNFLHNGLPQMILTAKWTRPEAEEPEFEEPDLSEELKKMLSRLNICSKEYVVRQYDHEVQGGSVIKPLGGARNDGPSDAGIVRPLLNMNEGVVISHGICPRYGDIDTYHMAACAIDEAIRNAICVGASPDFLAGLDNFCWCDPIKSEKNPGGEYKLAQLVRANKALYDYTKMFGVPCISGKDSMKNDYIFGDIKISIPPTLLFTVVGKIEDVNKAVTMDAKNTGDSVYIIGTTRNELGGSEYYSMHGIAGGNAPTVDKNAKKSYDSLHSAISSGLVESCHDCSDGGLAVALAESAFAGGLGMTVNLSKVPADNLERNDKILFSESASRFIVTVRQENKKEFETVMQGSVLADIGVVIDGRFIVKGLEGDEIINSDMNELKESWQRPLRW
ncbi:MAG: phosphoribosylformylglycinamidine synthase subunit PurL [Candidatus Aenigmatarchaeota archaeon]